jgi:hypothetical protein
MQSGDPRAQALDNLKRQRTAAELEYKKLKITAEKYYFFETGQLDNIIKFPELPRDIRDRRLLLQEERQLNIITAEDYRNVSELEHIRVRTRGIVRSR